MTVKRARRFKKCMNCGKISRLVKFKDGTRKYYCKKCDCYYVPAWMMDENLSILREKVGEPK